MSINIELKNVNQNFVPDASTLAKLIKVVEKFYQSPVEIYFTVATRFRVGRTMVITPDAPVEVTITESATKEDHGRPKDHTAQATEINQKIQDLLTKSKVQQLDKPSDIKISAGGKIYHFLDYTLVEDQEWR